MFAEKLKGGFCCLSIASKIAHIDRVCVVWIYDLFSCETFGVGCMAAHAALWRHRAEKTIPA